MSEGVSVDSISYEQRLREWDEFSKTVSLQPQQVQVPTVLGIKVWDQCPPLLFCPTSRAALVYGVNFALPWGLIMHFVAWKAMPASLQFFAILFAGVTFGFWMNFLQKRKRHKLALTTWEEFRYQPHRLRKVV